jgi:DeoR/GlpR family transcriptional regulator of sugar metabolism
VPKTSTSLLKRRLEIAEIVRKQGEIKVDDLSEQLGVSGVTIRSDLNYLEHQGYLKRSFGGAIYTAPQLLPHAGAEPPPPAKRNIAIELELARQCARTVQDRDTVFIGHGELCRKIVPLLSSLRKLRVIVNDLNHAILANDFIDGDIIVAGSELIRGQNVLSGKALESTFQQYAITHCFLEVQNVNAEGSFSIDLPLLAPYYQQLIDKAQQASVVISESSVEPMKTQPVDHLNQIDRLIISRSVMARYQQQLFEAGFNSSYANNECFTWTNDDKADT